MDHETSAFIEQAKRVRDYGIRSGALKDDGLIDALLPFDVAADACDPDKIAVLRRAARASYAQLDQITLEHVLRGEDPTNRAARSPEAARVPLWRSLFRSNNILILIGILVLALSFHYTYWTKKADAVLNLARELGETDYQSEMRRMVEVSLLVENPAVRDDAASDLVPNIFNTDIASFVSSAEMLQSYQISQRRFLTDAARLDREHNPVFWFYDKLHGLGLRAMALLPGGPRMGEGASELKPLAQMGAPSPPSEPKLVALTHYQSYLSNVDRINAALGLHIGMSNFAALRATQLSWQNQILMRTEITNRWILPMIYGALGSIIYSVVRYLNPFLSDPPLRTSFLRVLFGAFAGITISMLFGESDMFEFGVSSIGPSLLLICFLFGYSLDSFLSLLRRADAYVSSAFGPRTRDG